MVGIIIITHGSFGEALLEAVQNIKGRQRLVSALSISCSDSIPTIKNKMENYIASEPLADGWLILTDIAGGTPCNICLTLVEKYKEKAEILSGVNMYMVLSALANRESMQLQELKRKVIEDAQKSVLDVKEKLFKRISGEIKKTC